MKQSTFSYLTVLSMLILLLVAIEKRLDEIESRLGMDTECEVGIQPGTIFMDENHQYWVYDDDCVKEEWLYSWDMDTDLKDPQ